MKRHISKALMGTLFLITLLSVGCSDHGCEPGYATTASGLQYLDIRVETGAISHTGQIAEIHYTVWLADSAKVDSSRDRGTPFSFPLGQGRVIRGLEEGLSTMRAGGIRRLIIPPELGYGHAGAGGGIIPPDATLIMEVELLAVR
jgi:FKBP-type peptidyl-prolyl cis-trans isomerase